MSDLCNQCKSNIENAPDGQGVNIKICASCDLSQGNQYMEYFKQKNPQYRIMTEYTFESVKKETLNGEIKVGNKTYKMSPELQKAMKKHVASYEKSIQKMNEKLESLKRDLENELEGDIPSPPPSPD